MNAPWSWEKDVRVRGRGVVEIEGGDTYTLGCLLEAIVPCGYRYQFALLLCLRRGQLEGWMDGWIFDERIMAFAVSTEMTEVNNTSEVPTDNDRPYFKTRLISVIREVVIKSHRIHNYGSFTKRRNWVL